MKKKLAIGILLLAMVAGIFWNSDFLISSLLSQFFSAKVQISQARFRDLSRVDFNQLHAGKKNSALSAFQGGPGRAVLTGRAIYGVIENLQMDISELGILKPGLAPKDISLERFEGFWVNRANERVVYRFRGRSDKYTFRGGLLTRDGKLVKGHLAIHFASSWTGILSEPAQSFLHLGSGARRDLRMIYSMGNVTLFSEGKPLFQAMWGV